LAKGQADPEFRVSTVTTQTQLIETQTIRERPAVEYISSMVSMELRKNSFRGKAYPFWVLFKVMEIAMIG